jgi:uncharacterized membrane protein
MKKTLFFCVVFVLLISNASSYTFLNIYLKENGETTLIGETTDEIDLPSGITLNGNRISGKTHELTNKSGDTWTFSLSIEGLTANLIFPKTASIKSTSNGEIFLNGDSINIHFLNDIKVDYSINSSSNSGNSTSLLVGIVLFLILLVLVFFLINYTKREKTSNLQEESSKQQSSKLQKKTSKIEIIKQILNDREKIIIEKLKKTGKIKQSHLRKLTEIPKASFSRHIQELEKKKLIKRSGEGKNKFVELST